jgi:hypothetical protein
MHMTCRCNIFVPGQNYGTPSTQHSQIKLKFISVSCLAEGQRYVYFLSICGPKMVVLIWWVIVNEVLCQWFGWCMSMLLLSCCMFMLTNQWRRWQCNKLFLCCLLAMQAGAGMRHGCRRRKVKASGGLGWGTSRGWVESMCGPEGCDMAANGKEVKASTSLGRGT